MGQSTDVRGGLPGADRSLFRMVAERAPVMLWMANEAGEAIFFNASWLKFRGRLAHKELGDGWLEGVHPDDRGAVSACWRETVRSGRAFRNEYRLLRADGMYRWVLDEVQPLTDSAGACTGFVGSCADITELRQSRDQGREIIEHLRDVAGAIPGVLYRYEIGADGSRRYSYISDGVRELLGVEPASVLADADSLYRMLDPEEAGVMREEGRAALREGRAAVSEVEMRLPDGSRKDIRIQRKPRVLSDGSRVWTGLLTDVSADKRLSAELARHREQAELALETAVDGLWDWNVSTGELYIAPQNLRMLGYDPAELAITRIEHWRALYHPDEVAMIAQGQRDHFEGRTAIYEIVRRLRHRDGGYRWVRSRGRVVQRGARGEPIRMVGTNVDLTASRRADEALRASEERFRTAYDLAPVGIVIAAPDGRWLRVNAALCAMSGYNEDELCAMGFRGLTHPDDLEESERQLRDLVAGRTPVSRFEKRYVHRSGAVVWALVHIAPVMDAVGQLVNFIGMVHDITEQKLHQAQREETEARWAGILESSMDSIVTMDDHGRIMDFNAAAERTFGYSRDQVVGKPVDQTIVPARLRGRHASGLEAFMRTGAPGAMIGRRVEAEARHADGHEIPVEIAVVPVRLPGGRLIFTAYIRDLREQKQAQEHVRSSTERFRMLGELAPVGIFSTDERGANTYANPRWLEMTGLTADQAAGSGWTRALHHDDRERVVAEWNAAAATASDYAGQCRFVTPAGKVNWIYAAARPLRDGNGRVTGYLGTITDVTSLKEAEDRLRQSLDVRESLLRRERALRRELDHRVRNNLSALLGLVGLYEVPTERRLGDALRGKILAMREVHEIISAGAAQAATLRELIERLAGQLLTPAQARAVQVTGPDIHVAESQASALAMIFQELFTNARKHGSMSTGAGSIRVEWKPAPSPDREGIRLIWTESDGPPVHPPNGLGVGLRLIDGFAASELRGGSEFIFGRDGFSCILRAEIAAPPGLVSPTRLGRERD